MGPDPSVAAVRSAVRRDLERLDGSGGVLVACSGGADSLALAAAAAFVVPRSGRTVSAVVVDHGLQPGSSEVAERAAEQCRGLGVAAQVVAVRPTGVNEADARAARFEALEGAADAVGADVILLGHTLDDQAEQVLLALARGSGSRSLAGIPAVRGRVRRPLLGVRRATTLAACTVLGLEPWFDPTNHPDGGGARRSQIRHEAMPVLERILGPGVAEALARTADLLRSDAEVLEPLAADLLERARSAPGASDGGLDVAVLAAAPAALRTRALRSALIGWGAPAGSVSAAHVAAVEALVVDWSGQGPVDVPGLAVGRVCGRLIQHLPAG